MPKTVADILADSKAPKDRPRPDFEKGLRKLRKIDRLLDRLVAAARPEDDPVGHGDWELIYDAIFSKNPADIMPKAHAALELTGYRFPDYCDPDTTYEADARAWIEAFKEVLAHIETTADK